MRSLSLDMVDSVSLLSKSTKSSDSAIFLPFRSFQHGSRYMSTGCGIIVHDKPMRHPGL